MGTKSKSKAVKRTYEVRSLPPQGTQGRLGVVAVTPKSVTLIARYHTRETAEWVRRVMQDAT